MEKLPPIPKNYYQITDSNMSACLRDKYLNMELYPKTIKWLKVKKSQLKLYAKDFVLLIREKEKKLSKIDNERENK